MRERAAVGLLLIAVGALAVSAAAPEARPRVLPRPPFEYSYSGGKKPAARTGLRLVKLSERRNQITDTEAWFRRHDLVLPTLGSELPDGEKLPEMVPETFAGARLIRAIESGLGLLLLYSPDFSGARYLVARDRKEERPVYALDFVHFRTPPRVAPGEGEFVEEGVHWAAEADGGLYVANFHRTYAKSSGGKNAYLTALDPKTGQLVWRSRPLVANAQNFVIRSDAIVSGYGFTTEPDFLYVLDRATGAVAQTVPIRSAPEYLIPKNDRLYVRAYDTDYLFRFHR
jgi:hypothetical protein